MNIKKEVTKLPYDLIKLTYTNTRTEQTEKIIIDGHPKNLDDALKHFDEKLMKRFKNENSPSR